MNKTKILFMVYIITALVCMGCSNKDTVQKDNSMTQKEKVDSSESKEQEMPEDAAENTSLTISTEYVPVAFRSQTLIVQRNEKTELFGLLDHAGNTVLEPQYDDLKYTEMNGEVYLKAKYEDKMGVLNLDGSEKIPMQYEDIASTGKNGWLAVKDSKEFMLDSDGNVKMELNKIYCQMLDDKYLILPDQYVYNGTEKYDNIEAKTLRDYNDSIPHCHIEIYTMEQKKIADGNKFIKYIGNDIFLEYLYKNKDCYYQITNVANKSNSIIAHASADIRIDSDNKKIYYTLGNDGSFIFDLKTNKSSKDTATKLNDNEKYEKELNIKVVKSGDFYSFEDIDGKKISKERYADYRTEDNCLLVKNIDNKWGVMDVTGKMVIPFGEIEYGNEITYMGKEITKISNEENFCFAIQNGETYEFYSFPIKKP